MRKAISWVSCVLALILAGQAWAALPAGWSNQDIGTTGGSASETGGTWTVRGDGADIWGTSDAFHFVYRTLSGNGEVIARVAHAGSGSDLWSKGGVMMRETLAPGSKFALMALTGGAGGGLAFQNRPTTGGSCHSAHGNPTAAAPYWVKLTRAGNTITAYSSANGVDWAPQPAGVETDASPNPVEIPMAADVLVGLFVTSHLAGEIRTYTFDQVTVGRPVTAAGPQPKDGATHPDTWAQLSWTPDGAKFVATNVILKWTAGAGATSHRVHIGTDPNDVADAEGGKFQTTPQYLCPSLQPDTTYYWRVDESSGRITHQGAVWSFTTRPAELASAAIYYVDTDHPDAGDANPGTEAQPWKTIRRGTQASQPGDTVLIKAGTYREGVILHRSGTEANPIRIWAYPGQEGKVIINAAEPVTQWRRCLGPEECAGNPHWNHIYVADVAPWVQSHPNSSFAVRQVFQHGEPLQRSRYPNVGWSYPTSVTNPKTTFSDRTLFKSEGYFTGAVCHVKTAVWHLDAIPVTSFSRTVLHELQLQFPKEAGNELFGQQHGGEYGHGVEDRLFHLKAPFPWRCHLPSPRRQQTGGRRAAGPPVPAPSRLPFPQPRLPGH